MKSASIALGLALTGCSPPMPVELLDSPPLVEVAVRARLSLDMHMPGDLAVGAGGELWVLDGYRGRLVRLGADGKADLSLGDEESFGHPLRLAVGPDASFWLSDPRGQVLRVDQQGQVLARLSAPPLQLEGGTQGLSSPVALLDLGGTLVVSDRQGRLSWLDTQTGEVVRQVLKDAASEELAILADLVRDPAGGLLAVDTLQGRIQRLDEDGRPRASQGRFGAWVGYLKQPKAIEPLGDGAVVVADSELGALQLFDADGAARGLLAVDGVPLALVHPVAMARGKDGELLVLDAGAGEILSLDLDSGALSAALAGEPRRWLRAALAPARALDPVGGQRCLQCHSGVIEDGREVWDPTLKAHPVNLKPEKQIPDYFPLDEQGNIVCSTCHSPHGGVSLGELDGLDGAKEADQVEPHAIDQGTFLRVGRQASELCVACHTESAHEGALALLELGGGGHPTGAKLVAAMKDRPEGDAGLDPTKGQCLSCHAVHGAAGEHLTRQGTEGELCVACHEGEATAGHTHPMGLTEGRVAVDPEHSELPLDEEGHLSCQTCHALVGGTGKALLREGKDGATLCASCHTGQSRELGGDHARLRGDAHIGCLACHDPHGERVGDSLLGSASSATEADPLGCLSCHGPGGSARHAGVRPGVLGHPVDGEVHTGNADPLTCQSCHGAHDPRPTDEIAACESCHAEQADAKHRGGHGRASCLDCHPVHGDAPRARVGSDRNPRETVCLACHAEGSGHDDAPTVLSFSHPEMVFAPDGSRWTPLGGLPLFASDGSQQPPGVNGALTCSSCHLTHGPDASEPGDNLRRPGWKDACAACHGEKALPLYRYFHDSERWDDLEVRP